MQKLCHFCSRILNSLREIIEHYDNLHKINVENSPRLRAMLMLSAENHHNYLWSSASISMVLHLLIQKLRLGIT